MIFWANFLSRSKAEESEKYNYMHAFQSLHSARFLYSRAKAVVDETDEGKRSHKVCEIADFPASLTSDIWERFGFLVSGMRKEKR